jgi:hypothetical protein
MKQEILDKVAKMMDGVTKEDFDNWKKEYDEKNPPPPKGWVSIEDHLPMVYAGDYMDKGYSTFKVKDKDGKEFKTNVCDGYMWKYEIAIPLNITHWFNEI